MKENTSKSILENILATLSKSIKGLESEISVIKEQLENHSTGLASSNEKLEQLSKQINELTEQVSLTDDSLDLDSLSSIAETAPKTGKIKKERKKKRK